MIGRATTNRVETAHNATVAPAEPVIGPADDATIFFQPRGMVFVTMLWVIAVAWSVCLVASLAVLWPFGIRPHASDIVPIAESLLLVPAVGAGIGILVAWRRLGRLHTSVHGLEFAATGRRPRRRGDAYLVDIGLMSPGPEIVLAELHRRIPSKV